MLSNSLVNHVVVGNDLFLRSVDEILQTSVLLLEVNVAQTAVEKHFTRVQLELEAELLVIDVVVTAEVEQGVVKVGQCLLKVTHQKVGDALLEISYGEVLVQPHCALVAIDLSGVC